MRTRRRLSTNRINYIRQRHRNKVYDYANLILFTGFHSFSPFSDFLARPCFTSTFFSLFRSFVFTSHTRNLFFVSHSRSLPLCCFRSTLFLFLCYSVVGLSAYLWIDHRQIAAEMRNHLLANIAVITECRHTEYCWRKMWKENTCLLNKTYLIQ